MPESLNFSFLVVHDQQLVRLGALAERYFADDPNTCLIKLRQFGELLAQLAAANIGLYEVADERQIDLLNRLRDRGLIKGEVDRLFHELRKIGNQATHELSGNHRTALSGLKYALALGIWFHRSLFCGLQIVGVVEAKRQSKDVCEALAQHIDPSLPEKTLIFCATDGHADIVVNQLKQAVHSHIMCRYSQIVSQQHRNS
ncbi:MAG: DUF4145 domain-containing protein [Nostoc sp.]|uniref:DUF4145 domain-containing protein n=1 Tax=Nostoc sp. TaxID=1180 RepID=UPI002FF8D2A4